jgi:HNH endonuclease
MTASYPIGDPVYYKAPPSLSRYRVGTDGSMWTTLPRCGRGPRKSPAWRRLRGTVVGIGYEQHVLRCDDGTIIQIKVHRLVLMTFVGPCPPGLMGCHNDGNAANNRLSNLRWDTHNSNIQDAVKHGAYPVGSRRRTAKLAESDILKIREMLASGSLQRVVGAAFKVHQKTISRIANGENWKHVP